jgi:hypothetical protein
MRRNYCDICKSKGEFRDAEYDGKTVFGMWAFMCGTCFEAFGIGEGLGKGQQLKMEPTTKKGGSRNAKNRR